MCNSSISVVWIDELVNSVLICLIVSKLYSVWTDLYHSQIINVLLFQDKSKLMFFKVFENIQVWKQFMWQRNNWFYYKSNTVLGLTRNLLHITCLIHDELEVDGTWAIWVLHPAPRRGCLNKSFNYETFPYNSILELSKNTQFFTTLNLHIFGTLRHRKKKIPRWISIFKDYRLVL